MSSIIGTKWRSQRNSQKSVFVRSFFPIPVSVSVDFFPTNRTSYYCVWNTHRTKSRRAFRMKIKLLQSAVSSDITFNWLFLLNLVDVFIKQKKRENKYRFVSLIKFLYLEWVSYNFASRLARIFNFQSFYTLVFRRWFYLVPWYASIFEIYFFPYFYNGQWSQMM